MYSNRMKDRLLSSLSFAALAAAASLASAAATPPTDLSGQWVGGSLLDGQRESAKTVLDLNGTGDSTLRVESRMTCTLRGGNVASLDGSDTAAWTVSFKSAHGGEACGRMAQGKIVLRTGDKPRTLDFDLVYPGRDGASNHRHGLLSHYP